MTLEPNIRFRFAPSPNGLLHLGHAYSALVNKAAANAFGGAFLLRIEDIDTVRCTPAFEEQMLEDLAWLGIDWVEPTRRQSEHFADYAEALETLRDAGLAYPATLSRAALKKTISASENQTGEPWPRDPDGAPLYPTEERDRPLKEQEIIIASDQPFAWRLNMKKALEHIGSQHLSWHNFDLSTGQLNEEIEAPAKWGDVVLARKDTPTSYHLSVTIDDALQGITHVVRGKDLKPATVVHRLLQTLLGLSAPLYHHHELILHDDGNKLSKSNQDTSLAELRTAGLKPSDIYKLVGLA